MHMVESMGPAGVMAATAMMQQNQQQAAAPAPAGNGQPDDDTPLRVVPDLPLFGGDV